MKDVYILNLSRTRQLNTWPLLDFKVIDYLPGEMPLACENSRFSSLFAAGDASRGGKSATKRQKFHTGDVHQCLHNKSGSYGVPNANLFNLTFFLVDFVN